MLYVHVQIILLRLHVVKVLDKPIFCYNVLSVIKLMMLQKCWLKCWIKTKNKVYSEGIMLVQVKTQGGGSCNLNFFLE
jgi:hypothetical protein